MAKKKIEMEETMRLGNLYSYQNYVEARRFLGAKVFASDKLSIVMDERVAKGKILRYKEEGYKKSLTEFTIGTLHGVKFNRKHRIWIFAVRTPHGDVRFQFFRPIFEDEELKLGEVLTYGDTEKAKSHIGEEVECSDFLYDICNNVEVAVGRLVGCNVKGRNPVTKKLEIQPFVVKDSFNRYSSYQFIKPIEEDENKRLVFLEETRGKEEVR